MQTQVANGPFAWTRVPSGFDFAFVDAYRGPVLPFLDCTNFPRPFGAPNQKSIARPAITNEYSSYPNGYAMKDKIVC